jgi:uncharacterized protein YecE (DUF72 family)
MCAPPAAGCGSRVLRRTSMTVHIGISGWNYPGWRDGFYAGVAQKDWLAYCTRRFTGIEINASFYRLQEADTYRRWRELAPPGFRFTAKGHRYVTHNRKLRDATEPIRLERERARGLGEALAAVVWQLPHHFRCNLERLEDFCTALKAWPETRHAIEFRHESWFDDAVADCLTRHRIAVCQSDAADWPMWGTVTTDLVYVRLHGHTRTYASRYADTSLEGWARRVRRWRREGRSVHVYFDNDAEGHAPRDALRLMKMVGQRPAAA